MLHCPLPTLHLTEKEFNSLPVWSTRVCCKNGKMWRFRDLKPRVWVGEIKNDVRAYIAHQVILTNQGDHYDTTK